MLHHLAAVLLLVSTFASAHAILQPLSSSSRLPEERVHQNFLDERLRPPAGTLGPPAHLARCAVICCRTGAICYHLTFATHTEQAACGKFCSKRIASVLGHWHHGRR